MKYNQNRPSSHWIYNKTDQFFMRASPRRNMRKIITYISNNNVSDKYQQYYDIKLTIPPNIRNKQSHYDLMFGDCKNWHFNEETHCWTLGHSTIKYEMQHKYTVSIDGVATRDALARTMQYKNSINIKHNSSMFEFCYFDLIHNQNIILFNDEWQYLNITKQIIDINRNNKLN